MTLKCDNCQQPSSLHGEAYGTRLCPHCWVKAVRASHDDKAWQELMRSIKSGRRRLPPPE